MRNRSDHVRFRNTCIAVLRTAGLDVEAAGHGDDRPGDVSGLPGVALLTRIGDRSRAIADLHQEAATTRTPVVAVVSRFVGHADPLAILPLSSLIELLREYCPESDVGHALDPVPPLPIRKPSPVCIICGLSIVASKATMYCSKTCASRSWYLRKRAVRSGTASSPAHP